MGGSTIVLAMLLTAVAVLGAASVGSIRCGLGADAIEVRVFGRVVRRVQLSDIESVDRRGAIVNESWSGPRFWNAVTLRRRTGLFRNVIVTPDDPERFVAEVTERLRTGARPGPSG